MGYSITKQVKAKKQTPLYEVYRILIVIIAIPVIAVALLSLLLFYIFSRIWVLFVKQKNELPDEPYHHELQLLTNEHIKIIATEDESDTELTELNELWAEKVYHEETYLYRANTSPIVPAIHGKIICFYLKEQPGGAFLQLPIITDRVHTQLPNTRLIYLQYSDLKVIPIEEVGSFYLYNDSTDEERIKGFNEEEEVTIYLSKL